jgi:hypothetical protein
MPNTARSTRWKSIGAGARKTCRIGWGTAGIERYLEEGVIGPGKGIDAQHIAIATISRVDVLVSWNFSHIVNLARIRGHNSVNLRQGYPMLEIRSPREVFSGEKS